MQKFTVEEYLSIMPLEYKEKVKKWLSNKLIKIENLTLEEMVYSISTAKQLLNEEIKDCFDLTDDILDINLNSALIVAKENKIDNLINLYNNSNTYNKINFNKENKIFLDKITTLKNISLEIENFDYECPIDITISFISHDGEIINKPIIPFNYNGLYKELIVIGEFSSSKFKVANKENITFYTCEVTENSFALGKEIKLIYKKDYDFSLDGYLIILGERLKEQKLILYYQPNENSYEISLNKKIISVEMIVKNDFIGYLNNKIKKMVVK